MHRIEIRKVGNKWIWCIVDHNNEDTTRSISGVSNRYACHESALQQREYTKCFRGEYKVSGFGIVDYSNPLYTYPAIVIIDKDTHGKLMSSYLCFEETK